MGKSLSLDESLGNLVGVVILVEGELPGREIDPLLDVKNKVIELALELDFVRGLIWESDLANAFPANAIPLTNIIIILNELESRRSEGHQ